MHISSQCKFRINRPKCCKLLNNSALTLTDEFTDLSKNSPWLCLLSWLFCDKKALNNLPGCIITCCRSIRFSSGGLLQLHSGWQLKTCLLSSMSLSQVSKVLWLFYISWRASVVLDCLRHHHRNIYCFFFGFQRASSPVLMLFLLIFLVFIVFF